MTIEKYLNENVRTYSEDMEAYYQNPEEFSEADMLEFARATTRRDVAFWAQRQHMENNYNVAKKIIESIN